MLRLLCPRQNDLDQLSKPGPSGCSRPALSVMPFSPSSVVVTLARNEVAYPASRTSHISGVSGNNVDVGVKNRLARCFPTVHANVKSLRRELLLEYVLDLPDKAEGIYVLLCSHLPDGHDMSLWNNERMTVRDWEAVENRK